jgi:hypothetical protein
MPYVQGQRFSPLPDGCGGGRIVEFPALSGAESGSVEARRRKWRAGGEHRRATRSNRSPCRRDGSTRRRGIAVENVL